MIFRYPSYYRKFHCLASDCPDTCCKDWEVQVDEAAAAYYRQIPGKLGEDLRQALRTDEAGEAYMAISDGRCCFLRGDGLCRIQAELGHEALCKTCREFPRLTHDYGDFVEGGLELSCPEAARLILTEQEAAWCAEELPGGEAPQYDPVDMEILLRTRKVMLTILADERYTVAEALTLGLLYGYQAQNQLDGAEAEAFDPWAELAFAKSLAKPADYGKMLDFYKNLEILRLQWKERLDDPQGDGSWNPLLRALARYGVERYWLQAVSDFDLVGRVKMVILSCLLVRHLGGDFLSTAQCYAKEIENDADNVDAVLDGAYTHPALTDEKIFGMLLL